LSTIDPLIGHNLDNFLIQQLLGRGGMARVYKGLDTSLKRPVAIKVIEENFRATEAYRLRFEHEAQAVANLSHTNIVTVHHFGKQTGLYYLVMEYINGVDLDVIIRNYGASGELMPHKDVIRIIGEIASALDYAHAQGVIHRDIKPSNIMLERTGRSILTDFGLALRVSEGTVGETFGSPHYISPEQARNSASVVPQSDLYSLGIVVYELLTSVVPFDDPSPTTLAVQHIVAPVPSPRAFNHNLSEGVERVMLRILAKSPEERYQTGQEFVAALRAVLDSLQNQPMKVSTNELPPLPPGIEPPPPRRLSMQTALDKLSQHMLLEQAKGKALTQTQAAPFAEYEYPTLAKPRNKKIPLLALSGLGVLVIAILGTLILLLSRRTNEATVAAQATNTPLLTATQTVLVTQSIIPIVLSPTLGSVPTQLPSNTLLPSNTSTLTVAPVQPTATAILAVLPTNIPTLVETPSPLPTDAPTIAIPIEPTILYPDGLPITLIYDAEALYFANKSDKKITLNKLTFEQVLIDGQIGDRYEGNRWSQFYSWSEPRFCVVVHLTGKNPRLPTTECPRGSNSIVAIQRGENFWTASENAHEFRVLWNGQEIARCAIAAGRCELRLPRT
jgi:serine/threonine protein kinase